MKKIIIGLLLVLLVGCSTPKSDDGISLDYGQVGSHFTATPLDVPIVIKEQEITIKKEEKKIIDGQNYQVVSLEIYNKGSDELVLLPQQFGAFLTDGYGHQFVYRGVTFDLDKKEIKVNANERVAFSVYTKVDTLNAEIDFAYRMSELEFVQILENE